MLKDSLQTLKPSYFQLLILKRNALSDSCVIINTPGFGLVCWVFLRSIFKDTFITYS